MDSTTPSVVEQNEDVNDKDKVEELKKMILENYNKAKFI